MTVSSMADRGLTLAAELVLDARVRGRQGEGQAAAAGGEALELHRLAALQWWIGQQPRRSALVVAGVLVDRRQGRLALQPGLVVGAGMRRRGASRPSGPKPAGGGLVAAL